MTTTKTRPAPEQAEPEHPRPRNVVEAIVAVMRDVTAVGKDGRNTQSNYNFRGIDGTVNALGPAMRRHGLVCMPGTIKQFEYGEIEIGKNRTKQAHVRVVMIYRFVYSNDAGEISELQVEVPGEAMDSGDKATAKAMSVALRTNLLQSFTLPTEERDPDEDTYERSPAGVTADDIRRAVGQAHEQDNPAAYLINFGNRHGADVLATVAVTSTQDGKQQTVSGDEFLRRWIAHFEQAAAKPTPQPAPGAEGEGQQEPEPVANIARDLHRTDRPAERTIGPATEDAWTTPAPAEEPAKDDGTQTALTLAQLATRCNDADKLLRTYGDAKAKGILPVPVHDVIDRAEAAVVGITATPVTLDTWLKACGKFARTNGGMSVYDAATASANA